MAVFSLRSILQREVFTPRGERLLGVSFVWKARRKRKSAILCAAVSSDQSGQVVLVTVKADREHYKLSACWPATELTLVDGKDAVKETAEFHLHLDKVYKWVSSSSGEKTAFVSCLWKINQRYLQDKVKFINISPSILEVFELYKKCINSKVLPWQQGRAVSSQVEEEEDGYQELTAREAADIQYLMEQSELAVSNAKAFTQTLHANLQALDKENLLALLDSERQVGSLVQLLEVGLEEVARIEQSLSHHDSLLRTVQQQMDSIHTRNAWLQRIDRNHGLLDAELSYLVDSLTLSEEHVWVLSEGDLGKERDVKACVAAVRALTNCANTPLTPGQRKLHAVAEQLIKFESLRQIFEQRSSLYINALIVQQDVANTGAAAVDGDRLVLPKLTDFHQQLTQYAPLMDWLRETNPTAFQHLQKVYTDIIGKLYDRQMKDLFDAAKFKVSGVKETKRFGERGSRTLKGKDLFACRSSLLYVTVLFRVSHRRTTHSNIHTSVGVTEKRLVNRVPKDKVVEQMLSELSSVLIAEQQFLTIFFALNRGDRGSKHSLSTEVSRKWGSLHSNQILSRNVLKIKAVFTLYLYMILELLGCVEPRLSVLLALCEKTEPLSCLWMLKETDQRLHSTLRNPHASFYCSLLFCTLQLSQQSLQGHTEALCKEIENLRLSKKARMGLLPFVPRLEEFVSEGENVLRGSERRWGLDAAYRQLFTAAFVSVESLSTQSLRTHPLVVLLLNFHRLHGFISRLHLPELESLCEEAREKSALYRQQYVTLNLGQPLGTLTEFLGGVRTCLAHGVREEEVCFKLAYSKQELRKVIERHPGREVRKTIETLYKRVSRHLAEDESLLQVVWRAMQDELTEQCRGFEQLIERCYPGARIKLDFTEEELQQYFSSVSFRDRE
uniref:Exocyst complex component Sec3 PIP2-binding N-terminal domain-containing protein n=1 Tax=Lepisosteus oculatus TaxID=7918 RepID=W5NCE5_LEPOC